MASASSSAFVLSKVRYNVSLSPCHIAEPRVGIEQEMTSLLMRYSEPLSGVVLAFSNVRLAKPLGHIINEMPYIHCKVLADALVFQPREGMVLKGTVNKIGSNHIGMLFAGVFNGSVAASELPKGFVHNYAQDAWLDAKGNRIAVDDTVEAKVLRVHVAGGMIAIEASMRSFKGVATSSTGSAKAAPVVAKAPSKATKVSKPTKAVASEATPTKNPKKTKKTTEPEVAAVAPAVSEKKSKKAKKTSEPEVVAAPTTTASSKPSKKRKGAADAAAVAAAAPVVEETKKAKKKKTKKD